MCEENMRYTHLIEQKNKLETENNALKAENKELNYMLEGLQEAVNDAIEESVDQTICGEFEIDGVRTTAAYQDMVGILISNGYTVELTPLHNNTRMRIVVKESEELGNEQRKESQNQKSPQLQK